jgi:hypothetical protein
MNHPWMVKGFGGPPDNHLPVREALELPLDSQVIHAMTGFNFGPPDLIRTQLTEILQSEDYKRAVQLAARDRELQVTRETEKKRSFGFDFYKRRSSTNSRDTLTAPSSEALQLGNDPLNAFDPLISVYYLVREKQERDRLAANPGATSMPRSPNEAPLQMPEIAPPKAAYTNSHSYEQPGEKATGGRSRPRARTHGEDEVTDSIKNLKVSGTSGAPTAPAIVEPVQEPVKKESAAANLLRRFSTRRRRETPERHSDKYYPPQVNVRSPSEQPSMLRKSFSVRRPARDRDQGDASRLRSGSSQPHHRTLLTPPASSDGNGSGKINRSTSVNSAEYRRRHEDGPRVTYKEPAPSSSEHSVASAEKAVASEKARPEKKSGLLGRSSTTATRTKSLSHARMESIQARRARREEQREAGLPEETHQDLETNGVSREHLNDAENVKPVFLKGLFSVSTTSTKSVSAIRADIIRVLKQLNVEYSEIRGGFTCKHSPSIDLNKVQDIPRSDSQNLQAPSSNHRRRISFGGFNLGGANEREKDDAERMVSNPRPARRAPDVSYTNSDASVESFQQDAQGTSRRPAGETSTHVQSDLGGSMILEFEIFIVKVPLLSLHGIQFKRLAGGTWQYKNMADQILKELRL